jgi:hypothetical protein
MESFTAFGAAQAIGFGDLTVESDDAGLAIYGRLALTADAASHATLDHLIAVLTQARAGLAQAIARGDGPPSPPGALPWVPNPFT